MKKISILLAILLMIAGSACDTQDKPDEITTAMQSFLEAMKNTDFEMVKNLSYMGEMAPYPDENGELQEMPENGDLPQSDKETQWYKKFFENLSWELGEVKIEEDNATIDVVIKNKRVPEAFQMSLINAYMASQEEELTEERSFELVNESLSENLKKVEEVSTPLTIKFEKRDDKWLVERDEKLMLALYGNDSPPLEEAPKEESIETEATTEETKEQP